MEAAGETGKDMGRKSEEWRRDIRGVLSLKAKTALPSKSSLVTMNGPNESRGPIKDYSRRRFTITGPALGSIPEV